MKKTNSTKAKNSSSLNGIKLPLIEQNKKKTINRNDGTNLGQNQGYTSTSQLSKNSSSKNMNKNNTSAKKTNTKGEKLRKSSSAINDIITNVNKSHNINTKITSNKKTEEKNKLSQSKDSPKTKNDKINRPKSKEKINKLIFNKKRNIQIYKDYNALNNDNNYNSDNNKPLVINNAPRITKDRLKEIQESRRIRLIREKKQFEKQIKMLNEEKALINNRYGNKKEDIRFSSKINSPIEMSQKKAQSILEEGGMIDAYKFLISHLCKNGMPPGNLYEYCSEIIKNYEKEWKKKKYKMLNEEIQKHFEDKKKDLLSLSNMTPKQKLEYKVLEKREENQFIKKLDKSRSSLRIINKNPISNNINLPNNENKSDIISNSFEKNKKNVLKKIAGDNMILNGNKNLNDKKVYFNIKLKNTVGISKNDKKNGGGKNNSPNIVNNNNKMNNIKSTKNNNNNIDVKKINNNIIRNNNNSPKAIKKEENKKARNNSSKTNSKITKSNNTTKSNLKKNKSSKNIS